MKTQILERLNRLTNWQAIAVIAVVGFAVFSVGLSNPFQGDDAFQIVNNVPVHSIRNVKLLFEGGTFYNGQGLAPLDGVYYRPIMMVVFSVLYSLFGPHPIYYHAIQLILGIGSAIFLYLFLRYSFTSGLALFLSIVFLVHPLNSQVIFAIPTTQDTLFFFFGILALWLLLRFDSKKSLIFVSLSLFLSIMSKETGLAFVFMALIYLVWWNKNRLIPFAATMVIPIALWLILKIYAVGLSGSAHNAPIDNLSFAGRLFTAPSIALFYLAKFVFPLKLASAYHWVYPQFSYRHVLLPLIVDLLVMSVLIGLAFNLRSRATKAQSYTYNFFLIWFVFGLGLHLQILPLDFTATEPWFYFSSAGLLGMFGVAWTVISPKINFAAAFVTAILVIGLLGFRTWARGLDWSSESKLARADIAASPDDFSAYTSLSEALIRQGNENQALPYLEKSTNIFPTFTGYLDLGVVLTNQAKYPQAVAAYDRALKLSNGSYVGVYEDLGMLTLIYGNDGSSKQFLLTALEKYPHDANLWLYLALIEDRMGDNTDAKAAISNAASYGGVSQIIYSNIMNNQSFNLNYGNTGRVIKI